MARARGKQFCFTLNNPTQEDRASLLLVLEANESDVAYLCFGEEVGASGTPHFQGFLQLKKRLSLSTVKAMLPGNPHLEVARGTFQQNRTYCSKDGQFLEMGEEIPTRQGQRTDLSEIQALLRDGVSLREIAHSHFASWVRYRASLTVYAAMVQIQPSTPRFALDSFPENWQRMILNWEKTQILWGESGIGKTELALALLPGALVVSHMDELRKFDTSVHSGIIFDDVDLKHFPRTSQIHICDQTIGRAIHIRYDVAFIPENTKKIFTTNEAGGNCVQLSDSAIKRRCEVHHLIKLN